MSQGPGGPPTAERQPGTPAPGPVTEQDVPMVEPPAPESPGDADALSHLEEELVDVDPETPLVSIVMGSESDRAEMEKAGEELDSRGIRYEVLVMSAHREPDAVAEYARNARKRKLRVIIAGAGLSAALPGVVSAHTNLPVIGVPLVAKNAVAGGLDALLSIAQMPPGVPVASVGLNGARNAAVLAARILDV